MTWRDRRVLLLFSTGLLLFFGNAWLTRNTFFARDLTYLFHPMHVFSAENLQAGRVPLWNPYVSGGVYWIGQPQTGLLAPGNLVFWLFPFVPAFKMFQALHFFLSGLGGYLLVRARRGGRGTALAAAFLWGLNGFWLSRVEFPPLLGVITWTPWALLFLTARDRGVRVGGAAAVWAFALTAGHWPHVAWMGLCVVAGVAALRPRPGAVGELAVSLGLGLGVAAAQVLPGVDLMAQSARVTSGLDPAVAGLYALRPINMWGLFSPLFSAFPMERYTGERFFWLGCFYVGGTAAVVALGALRRSPARARAAWGGLFTLGALLSLGTATPVYGFLSAHVPLLGGVRYPAQYAYWMTVSVLAVFSLYGGAGPARRGARWAVVTAILAEMAFWGVGRQPTLPGAYFHSRPAWVRPLQASGGRLFLSPKAVGLTQGEGRSLEESWTGLRHRLLHLGTLPYHIENVNPYGFSLNPDRNERVLMALYGASGPAAAAPRMDALGVRWLAAPAPLSAPGLTAVSTGTWFLYARAAWAPGVTVEGPSSPRWEERHPRPGRVVYEGPAASGVLVTRDLWQKDWRAAGGGREWPVTEKNDFAAVSFDRPLDRLTLWFDPASWRWGLTLSLLTVAGGLGLGFRAGRRSA